MYHQEAITLLRWLAYARSPPTLGELVDASITDPQEESFIDTSERGGLRDVLNILSGLVTIVENQGAHMRNYSWAGFVNNDTSTASNGQCTNMFHSQHLTIDTRVKLAHFSVKEYLESERMLGSRADHFHLDNAIGHQSIAQSCLTYLRYYSISNEKTSTEQDFELFPMLKYAAESWFYHAALQHSVEGCREASFLENDSTRYDWLSIHDPNASWVKPFSKRRNTAPGRGIASPLGLYYASLLGLDAVVHRLLSHGADINAQGGRYGNALQAASATAKPKVVRLLLDSGVDVNAQGGYYGNALQAASRASKIEMVELLLDNGADVNAHGGYYGNALQAASTAGDVDKVLLLLNSGADVTIKGGWCGTVLQAASARGELEVVKLLLDSGADVNAQGGYYGDALQAASAEGNLKMVQLLLDNGADVNAQGGWYDNALYAASEEGHTGIVRLLLESGVDINAQGGRFDSALQAASVEGHTEIVHLLQSTNALANMDNECTCNSHRIVDHADSIATE
jgi:ankyrin repeat protein